jgi:mannose-binding lectin 2
MGMIGDGQTSYDQANDGKANELGGCSVRHFVPTDLKEKY